MVPLKKKIKRYNNKYLLILFAIVVIVSATSLISSLSCQSNNDCGMNAFIGSEYCKNDDVYKDALSFTCNNPGLELSSCSNTTIPILVNECNDDLFGTFGDNYCKDNNIYHSRINLIDKCQIITPGNIAGCVSEFVNEDVIVEHCTYGCIDGEEECKGDITCTVNSDCGTNGFIGVGTCTNDDVFKDYISFTCNNPGNENSYCTNLSLSELFSDCGDDYCENIGNNYCKDGNIYANKNCYDKGCNNNNCFSNLNIQENLVKECEFGCFNSDCIEGTIICNNNSDCGTDGYIGEHYCDNHDLYRDYKLNICVSPGTISSHCTNEITTKLIEKCNYDCKNDECVPMPHDDRNGNNGLNNSFEDAPKYPLYGAANYSNLKIEPKVKAVKDLESKNKSTPLFDSTLVLILIILIVLILLILIIVSFLR